MTLKTILQSSSSSPSHSLCSHSSSSSPSSSDAPCSCCYINGATIESFGNQSQLAGNWVPTVAGFAMERLRFIDRMAQSGTGWKDMEELFDRIASTSGPVPLVNRSDFAFCIGMEETPEFAEELLQALQGRSSNRDDLQQLEISKTQLHDYWSRINDPSFNSRIQIFFNL